MTKKSDITGFFHCNKCFLDLPVDDCMKDFARLEVGWTAKGFQVRCIRHDLNIMNVDFKGQKMTLIPDVLPSGDKVIGDAISSEQIMDAAIVVIEALETFLGAEFDLTYAFSPGSDKPFTDYLDKHGFVVVHKSRMAPPGWTFSDDGCTVTIVPMVGNHPIIR